MDSNELKYKISSALQKVKKKFHRGDDDEFEDDFDDENGNEPYDFYHRDALDDDPSDAAETEEDPEDGEIVFPEDEEDEASQAKMLKRKHILAAGGVAAFVAVSAMAYSAFTPATDPSKDGDKPQHLSQSTTAMTKTDQALPSKYSDIAKYDKSSKKTNPNGGTTQGTTPPSSGYGTGTTTHTASTPYRPAQSAAQTSGSSAVSVRRTPAPAAAPSPRPSSSSSNSGGTSVSVQPQPSQSPAQKAAEQAKKAENEAMNSAIAFKIAAAVTKAVASNTAPAAMAAEPPVMHNEPSYLNASSSGEYTLQAGSVIPATLQTGITSDTPNADVVALVRQDVYDSLTGTHLLIPQGSKIIGKYGSLASRGNKRIGVIFNRIILPDGSSLDLPNQNAIDGTGMPGLKDKYTSHSSTLFKTAFMTALLGAAAQSATGNSGGDDDRSPGQEAVSGAVAQVMETASNLLSRDSNINPTITIAPGMQFSIFINKDLLIGEYDE